MTYGIKFLRLSNENYECQEIDSDDYPDDEADDFPHDLAVLSKISLGKRQRMSGEIV